MPIRGDAITRALGPLLTEGAGDADGWFDAHTHIGANDPDEQTATAAEIRAGLDAAGHCRALN